MKKVLCILIMMTFYQLSINAQSGTWVWIKGADSLGSPGDYGVQGVASSTNEPECSYQSAYWLDNNGDFWIFSGVNFLGNNALWKYSPSTNNWTWIRGGQFISAGNYGTQGVPSPLNDPPTLGYGANCWTDSLGDLWLYAGSDLSSFNLSDNLWRYHIATNEWTWMKGTGPLSNNSATYGPLGMEGVNFTPGSRGECKSGWVYDNKLWLFGGSVAMGAGDANDIWSFNLSNMLWAWQGGGQSVNSVGNFGVKGVPSATNEPPGRMSYTKWQDANNFYLFGGFSMNSTSAQVLGLNDVWKFDKITKLWTWISGSNLPDELENSNGYCKPQITSSPQARFENQTAQTASICVNAFWTFGGFDGNVSSHNDLWLFNTGNLEWTKVKGEASVGGVPAPFNYGTKGVLSPTNLISGRGGPAVWTDASANLFVFGGLNGSSYLNDLWKFIPDTACVKTGLVGSAHLVAPSNTNLCVGDTLQMSVPTNVSINISPTTNVVYTAGANEILFLGIGVTTYTIIAQSVNANDPCFINDTVSFTINLIPDPIADFNVLPEIATIQNATFTCTNTSSNATSYEWYDQDGNLLSTSVDLIRTESKVGKYCYTLVATNQCGKKSTKIKCVEVIDDGYLVVPNVFSPDGNGLNDFFIPVKIGNEGITKYSFKIFNRWGMEIFTTKDLKIGWDGNFQNKFCEIGTYFYLIETTNSLNIKKIYKGDVSLIR